tara:strand:- start:10 stop:375 length:366 start_codon:yes stop_codon:yes gene_type:complete
MITEQQDIYFIEGNPQKGYKPEYASKIGVILPPNPGRGENEPTFLLNMLPQRQGKMVVMPKGQKPGQGAAPQGGGFQPNAYQQASQSTGGGYPNQQIGDPGPRGPNDYNQNTGQHFGSNNY